MALDRNALVGAINRRKGRKVTPLPQPKTRPQVPTDNMPQVKQRPATDNMPQVKQRPVTPLPQPKSRQPVPLPRPQSSGNSNMNALMAKKLERQRNGGTGTPMGG